MATQRRTRSPQQSAVRLEQTACSDSLYVARAFTPATRACSARALDTLERIHKASCCYVVIACPPAALVYAPRAAMHAWFAQLSVSSRRLKFVIGQLAGVMSQASQNNMLCSRALLRLLLVHMFC